MSGPDPAHGLASDIRRRIVDAVPQVIKALLRPSGPGPTGSHFEHWMTSRDSNEGIALAAELVVRLIEGRAPPEIIVAHLSAQVAGHPKPNDPGSRGSVGHGKCPRRIALQAVCHAFRADLRDARTEEIIKSFVHPS